MRENHAAFHKIWFRPRVLVDVENVDMTTTMLGTKVSIPFYVTATALGKLGHPEGEVVLTKAAKQHQVVQMIPTLASCSFDEIVDARQGDQVQWLQLYVNKDREITRRIVQHAEKRGATVIEAYPVDPSSPSYRFMGYVQTFVSAGFYEVGRAGTRRHVLRRELRK